MSWRTRQESSMRAVTQCDGQGHSFSGLRATSSIDTTLLTEFHSLGLTLSMGRSRAANRPVVPILDRSPPVTIDSIDLL